MVPPSPQSCFPSTRRLVHPFFLYPYPRHTVDVDFSCIVVVAAALPALLASHAHNNNLFLLGNGSPRVCSRSLDFAPLLYAPKIELATSARKVLHLGPNQLHYHGAVQFNGAFTMTVGSLIGDLSVHASLLLESSIALQFGLSCMYSISVAWSLNLA